MNPEVYLIRHANSEYNHDFPHLICGRNNSVPLTERGIEQSKNLGRHLLRAGLFPTQVHISPAVRTMATAVYSLGELWVDIEPQIDYALQEMSQGIFEGLDRDETYNEAVKAEILRVEKDFKLEGGESMNETCARMQGWLDDTAELTAPDSRTFVYTHGMAIRCLLGGMYGWSHEQTRATGITPNTSIAKLVFDGSQWELDYCSKKPEDL